MRAALLLLCAGALTGPAHAQPSTPAKGPVFTQQAVDQGRDQYHRTCAQCHGRNMVNAGTTVYDLRKFPADQHERFLSSVVNGKGNMPAFKGAIDEAAIAALWAYVATRGGKEM